MTTTNDKKRKFDKKLIFFMPDSELNFITKFRHNNLPLNQALQQQG